MADARPNRYTHYTVSQTVTERDTNYIMELDLRFSKRGLYKQYTYLHGWKITTTSKGTIIKSSLIGVDDNNDDKELQQLQINICSWEFTMPTL